MCPGIDDVVRAYQPKRLIRLECEHCATDQGDIRTRECLSRSDMTVVLCQPCFDAWCPRGRSGPPTRLPGF